MGTLRMTIEQLSITEDGATNSQTIEFETDPLSGSITIEFFPVDERTYHPQRFQLDEIEMMRDFLTEFLVKCAGA